MLALRPGVMVGIRGGGKESLRRDNLVPFLREACLGFSQTCINTTSKDPFSMLSNMYVLPEAVSFVARSSFC